MMPHARSADASETATRRVVWPKLRLSQPVTIGGKIHWGEIEGSFATMVRNVIRTAAPQGPDAPHPWEIMCAGVWGSIPDDLPPLTRLWLDVAMPSRLGRNGAPEHRDRVAAAQAAYATIGQAVVQATGTSIGIGLREQTGLRDLPLERVLSLDPDLVIIELTNRIAEPWAVTALSRVPEILPSGR